jgi:hypothetical protein
MMKRLTPDEMIQSTLDAIRRNEERIAKEGTIPEVLYAFSAHNLCLAREYMGYKNNAELFKKHTHQGWEFYDKLLHSKEVPGYLIDKLTLIIRYNDIMQFLAAGLVQESEKYGQLLWNKWKDYEKFGHPFMELMTKTFLLLLLDQDKKIFLEWIEKFYERCRKPRGEKYFIGFVKMMDGVFQKNGKLIEEGLQDIIKFKGSIKRSDFDSIRNNVHCLWAIGLANLAISRGIRFLVPDDDYLPKALLIDV